MLVNTTFTHRFLRRAFSKEIVAVLILLLAIVFFRSERRELHAIIPSVMQAHPGWIMAGIVISFVYIFFQAGMYTKSFRAIGLLLPWTHAVALFLKRNFISVFLPAGSVSALAYSPSQIRKAGFSKTQVLQASGLFAFAGLLTTVLADVPVVVLTIIKLKNASSIYAGAGLVVMVLLIAALVAVVRSIVRKGRLFVWLNRKFPQVAAFVTDLFTAAVQRKHFSQGVLFSLGVELTGMLHVYVAMLALGVPASFMAAAAAYMAAVLMMVVSPFLRGLGAVEISMVFILEQFGYSPVQALSVMVLFRVFEFWLPLLAGVLAFAWKGRKLFMRAAPALLTFCLGFVNIISVVLPPIRSRMHLLHAYLPLDAIHASNFLVLFMGIALLVTSAFLLRGLRNAWFIALALSVISLFGHLTKALDYEEAMVAAVTAVTLLLTSSQYRMRGSNKWMKAGLQTVALSVFGVLLFGFLSFYFIDKKHFGMDFTWRQSILFALRNFLLLDDTSLHPVTRFGVEFIGFIKVIGFLTWSFVLLTLIIPYTRRQLPNESFRQRASFLLQQYGSSAVDYFKLYKDKLYFFSDVAEAFIAYRLAGGFAIVLEEPVCADEYKAIVLHEFDGHCRKMGLKTAFYRVNEDSIPYFDVLKKKKLMIGQEGILEIAQFSLEGRDRKSLRNGLNYLLKNGFVTRVHTAPLKDTFVEQLKAVSDEWLAHFTREEMIFAQGMFDASEIRKQDIVSVADAEGKIIAFLNIIPDYAEDECTYDLIRKTMDAPGAAIDALIIQLVAYAKEKKMQFVNLGMVPLSGMAQPENTAEQLLQFIAPSIKRFKQYHGLREFKDKYATFWENKYLVYEHDFDLLQLPNALKKVMRPSI